MHNEPKPADIGTKTPMADRTVYLLRLLGMDSVPRAVGHRGVGCRRHDERIGVSRRDATDESQSHGRMSAEALAKQAKSVWNLQIVL